MCCSSRIRPSLLLRPLVKSLDVVLHDRHVPLQREGALEDAVVLLDLPGQSLDLLVHDGAAPGVGHDHPHERESARDESDDDRLHEAAPPREKKEGKPWRDQCRRTSQSRLKGGSANVAQRFSRNLPTGYSVSE